jgi:hypothetical protein
MIEITPNLFAFAALLAWPIVAVALFASGPPAPALIWTMLGAHLLLPVGTVLKLPVVPGLDKNSIPALVAFACLLGSRASPKMAARFRTADVLLMVVVILPIITSYFNGDDLWVGGALIPVVIPGVGLYDGLAATFAQLFVMLPFWLGRRYLRSPDDVVSLLRALTIAGLAYSLLILFEVRMSPQLHIWVYGYFPHFFDQQVRAGGYRPVVFLGHGLLVAFFVATSILSSAALWRSRTRALTMIPPAAAAVWLGVMGVLCKSFGAFLYAFAIAPVIFFTKPLFQVRLAAALVALALLYPMLRTADLVPAKFLVDVAADVSGDRAASLGMRFTQEQMLLEHAWQRPWFGWGRYGRGRVYDERTGRDTSVTDGYWIITITTNGIIGFLAQFGLLALTVFAALGAINRAESGRDRIYLAALALIVAVGVVDLLPNASISAWGWLLAGALLGRSEALFDPVRVRRHPARSHTLVEEGAAPRRRIGAA